MLNPKPFSVKILFGLGIVLLLGFSPLWAEELVIRLDQPTFTPLPVRVLDLKGSLPEAQNLTDILRKDLESLLLFKVLHEPPVELQGLQEFLITGRVERAGSLRLVLKLEDLREKRVLLHQAFRGPPEAGRYMVHRFVDRAVEKMVGFPGVVYSRVAFVRRTERGDELCVMDFDHYGLKVVYRAPILLSPRLSPDARRIAFVSYDRGRPEVKILDLPTGKLYTLAAYPGLNASPVWHPNGRRLVVTLSKDGNPDLYLLDLSGRILRRLTQGEGVNTGGAFSPDGKYLAFVSDRTGSPQIYIYDFFTGGTRRLTFSGRYNVAPSWSPKGDRIVYAGRSEGRFVIYTIDPAGGDPVPVNETGSFEEPVFGPHGAFLLALGKDKEGAGLYFFLANGAARRLYLPGKNIRAFSWQALP